MAILLKQFQSLPVALLGGTAAVSLATGGLAEAVVIAAVVGINASAASLSGKDPYRIDRVGTYAARYAAKNVVAAELARECEILLTYCIGMARPVSVQVETFGTGRIPDAEIAALVRRRFEFRLAGIVQQSNLRRLPAPVKGGFFRKLAAYGQVGRMDVGLPWEVTDRAALLREQAAGRGPG
ncbi:methionine adenosyltransferase domain-containing protein [Geomesophilobacter sediminis]|uniref:Methionine adenosyltransferase domain-containing protein n=1 Tax=Geomesophilobacter sediminis TaxID=2798584 RepID=A0A8J7JDY8_9BACT|nr:methionine adenosyltransferase domain-containing protein [Geomesophilobacter sediminis]MBJ6724014.1 methionine adenosyltransferase domain-containing protein [Geomesophilobacter sediminis]